MLDISKLLDNPIYQQTVLIDGTSHNIVIQPNSGKSTNPEEAGQVIKYDYKAYVKDNIQITIDSTIEYKKTKYKVLKIINHNQGFSKVLLVNYNQQQESNYQTTQRKDLYTGAVYD